VALLGGALLFPGVNSAQESDNYATTDAKISAPAANGSNGSAMQFDALSLSKPAGLNLFESSSTLPMPPALATGAAAKGKEGLPRFGVGVKMSTLGIGIEAATALSRKVNLRGGYNFLSYNRNFGKSGITYTGGLNFHSVEGHLDFFPFGGSFHLSPGFLFPMGDQIKATANVPGGDTFTLGGTTYESDPTNPIKGNGKIDFNASATALVGFGNLLPRKRSKHFSISFEGGAAFQGSPNSGLNLTGNACNSSGLNCVNAATDPTVQSNILAEEKKINKDLAPFKIYPLISFGFGVKF
jgi:hypothetical protein